MTGRPQRLIGWAAAFAVALQTILGGFDSRPVMAGFDPATIICHGDPSTTAGGPDAPPASAHDCCDHCVLCKTMSAADGSAQPGVLTWPADRRAGLHPEFARDATANYAYNSNLPRGPPARA